MVRKHAGEDVDWCENQDYGSACRRVVFGGIGEIPMGELNELLSQMTGRHVTVHEVQDGLGMAKGTYYTQRDQGRLHQPANLLKVARAVGVNPVALLVHYGHLSASEVTDYAKTQVNKPVVAEEAGDFLLFSPEKVAEVEVKPTTGRTLTPDEMVAAVRAALDNVQVQLRQHAEALEVLRSRESATNS